MSPAPQFALQIGTLNDVNLATTALFVGRYQPFYQYSFGLMLDKLVEQLKYRTNVMAVVDGRLAGYVGWINVQQDLAEQWLVKGGNLPPADFINGDALIITIAVTENPKYLMPLLRAVSHLSENKVAYCLRAATDKRVERRKRLIKGRPQPLLINAKSSHSDVKG